MTIKIIYNRLKKIFGKKKMMKKFQMTHKDLKNVKAKIQQFKKIEII